MISMDRLKGKLQISHHRLENEKNFIDCKENHRVQQSSSPSLVHHDSSRYSINGRNGCHRILVLSLVASLIVLATLTTTSLFNNQNNHRLFNSFLPLSHKNYATPLSSTKSPSKKYSLVSISTPTTTLFSFLTKSLMIDDHWQRSNNNYNKNRTPIPLELSGQSAEMTSFEEMRNSIIDDEMGNVNFYDDTDRSSNLRKLDDSVERKIPDSSFRSASYNDTNGRMMMMIDDNDLDHRPSNKSYEATSLIQKQHSRINNQTQAHRRFKRGVLSLASMIQCTTKCNPLSYKDYGCYCGFQGNGQPMDGIDKCCYMHDLCYEHSDCPQALVYFFTYKWVCRKDGRVQCGFIINGNSKQLCGFQLCECDKQFAKCLSKFRCPKSRLACSTPRNNLLAVAKLFS